MLECLDGFSLLYLSSSVHNPPLKILVYLQYDIPFVCLLNTDLIFFALHSRCNTSVFLFPAFDIHSVSFEIIFKGSRERFVRLKAMLKCDINNFFIRMRKLISCPLTSSFEHTPLPYHLLTPGIHDENATQKNLQCELTYAASVFPLHLPRYNQWTFEFVFHNFPSLFTRLICIMIKENSIQFLTFLL